MFALVSWPLARSSVSAGPKGHPTQLDQPKLIIPNNAFSRSRTELSNDEAEKAHIREREGRRGKNATSQSHKITHHVHMCGQAFFTSEADKRAGKQARPRCGQRVQKEERPPPRRLFRAYVAYLGRFGWSRVVKSGGARKGR